MKFQKILSNTRNIFVKIFPSFSHCMYSYISLFRRIRRNDTSSEYASTVVIILYTSSVTWIVANCTDRAERSLDEWKHADTVDDRETDERQRRVTVPLETSQAANIFVRSLAAPSRRCVVAKNHSRWRWFLSASLSASYRFPVAQYETSFQHDSMPRSANVKVHYCQLWKSFCSKVYLSSGPGPFTEKRIG